MQIEGLDELIDVDLTFTRRTDEIEFTTEECIKNRLETIKRNSPEDYKYVIANILLAKKFLKSAGAYKKKNATNWIHVYSIISSLFFCFSKPSTLFYHLQFYHL